MANPMQMYIPFHGNQENAIRAKTRSLPPASPFASASVWVLAVFAVLLLGGCGSSPDRTASPNRASDSPDAPAVASDMPLSPASEIAVSNTWLESCLRDIEGGDTDGPPAAYVRVCPPGTCPGHFDMRPGTVADLRRARAFLVFDFQQSMREKIRTVVPESFEMFTIEAPVGLSLPSSYIEGCVSVHAALCQLYPKNREWYDTTLAATRERIAALEADVLERIGAAELAGTKIIASGHQAAFCRWLGLEPVAQFSGPETTSPRRIEALLEEGKATGVRFVIANRQENAQAGEALAHRLGVPVVTFTNFPSMRDGETNFDAMVRGNVERLLHAADGER